jgi:hypothetical protein
VYLAYRRYSEDNEVGFLSVQNSLLYRLRGYGTFIRTPFVSGERLIRSDQGIAGMSYRNDKGWKAEMAFELTNGEVVEGTANPNPQGSWNDTRIDFSISKSPTEKQRYSWELNYTHFRQAGIDPVFQAINYYLILQELRAVVIWNPVEDQRTEFSTGYLDRQQDDIVAATQAHISHAFIEVSTLLKRKRIYHHPKMGWYYPVNQRLTIGNPGEISQALIIPDFDILKQGFIRTSYRFAWRLLDSSDLVWKLEPSWRFNQNFNFLILSSSITYTLK